MQAELGTRVAAMSAAGVVYAFLPGDTDATRAGKGNNLSAVGLSSVGPSVGPSVGRSSVGPRLVAADVTTGRVFTTPSNISNLDSVVVV